MERAGELAAKRRRKEELAVADCGHIQGTDPSIHAVSSSWGFLVDAFLPSSKSIIHTNERANRIDLVRTTSYRLDRAPHEWEKNKGDR
jgi:hypothetical protein